ncbi:MAG: cytochrome c [Candidatus Acidiferrales bacterium]
MNQDKAEHRVIFAFAVLVTFFVGFAFLVGSVVRASPVSDSASSSTTFRTKCVMCHGQDGAGSAVGQTMNVPDLRSPAVQKLSDPELARIISDGKGGMPSFKSSLSEDRIHSLVTYIRSFAAKK